MNDETVLIVDDNKYDRYILRRQLKNAGIDCTIFEEDDGSNAIEFLSNYHENTIKYPRGFPPTLIFLDINMPNMDGLEFLDEFARLRKEIDIHSTSVIMFTSSEQEQDRAKALSFDFVKDYMVKGNVSQETFQSTIKNFL